MNQKKNSKLKGMIYFEVAGVFIIILAGMFLSPARYISKYMSIVKNGVKTECVVTRVEETHSEVDQETTRVVKVSFKDVTTGEMKEQRLNYFTTPIREKDTLTIYVYKGMIAAENAKHDSRMVFAGVFVIFGLLGCMLGLWLILSGIFELFRKQR